jgi:hypothetical protein
MEGHKFFTPMEMKALSENQIHERIAAAKFEAKLVCLFASDKNYIMRVESLLCVFALLRFSRIYLGIEIH